MITACTQHWKIKNLIESNVKSLKTLEKRIETDFDKQFQTKITFCPGVTVNKNNNGVDHAQIDKLARAFEESEKGYLAIQKAKEK